MFRSPPPHRHSSGHRGGKSQLHKDQLALQRLVQRVGFDALPINDESLRPFLKRLWNAGETHKLKVWSFDIPAQWPDRIFHGLMGAAQQLSPIAVELQADLKAVYSLEEIKRAVPVFKVGGTSALYFEGIWTPKDALDFRRH